MHFTQLQLTLLFNEIPRGIHMATVRSALVTPVDWTLTVQTHRL